MQAQAQPLSRPRASHRPLQIYPLIRKLTVDGIPVTVTCRGLHITRQPYNRWLESPITDVECADAHLANALFDAHRDDPEFGYRFLADAARAAGHRLADRTAWRICSDNGWWSVFGKRRRGKRAKVGTPGTTTLCVGTSPHPARTACGSRTSPSTRLGRASCICALSRTSGRTGSSATRWPSGWTRRSPSMHSSPVRGVADLRQGLARRRLCGLRQRVDNVGDLVHPVALLAGLGEDVTQRGPEPERPVALPRPLQPKSGTSRCRRVPRDVTP